MYHKPTIYGQIQTLGITKYKELLDKNKVDTPTFKYYSWDLKVLMLYIASLLYSYDTTT